MNILKEFKAFAMKGNVVDMAIGVVIGGAFGKIVTSLVNDMIMPVFSLLTGRVSFTNWKWVVDPPREGLEPIIINYGSFLQNVFDFLIIAFSIFITIKFITRMANKMKQQKEDEIKEEIKEEPKVSAEELLLREIRDLLKEQQENKEEALINEVSLAIENQKE